MFENKTNSSILANLKLDEDKFKYEYMKGKGLGLELLEALHTYISPEEIYKHHKAFNISKNRLKYLKGWLDSNCNMFESMKTIELGYQYISKSLFESGGYGVLSKIRRHVVEWEPKIDAEGNLIYTDLHWLEIPKVIFQNEDSILVTRKCNPDAYKISYRTDTFMGKDTFYEKQSFAFKLENNKWRKANINEANELKNAMIIMEELVTI